MTRDDGGWLGMTGMTRDDWDDKRRQKKNEGDWDD